MFEDMPCDGYSVYKYRPQPCTPAGDMVCKVSSKSDADEIVKLLDSGRTIEDCIKKFGEAVRYT